VRPNAQNGGMGGWRERRDVGGNAHKAASPRPGIVSLTGPILSFYRREGTDDRGRTLDEVRSFDHQELESVHDYIQWLFPLAERSAFNPEAPKLTPGTIDAFRADPALLSELAASLVVMLHFFGLRLTADAGSLCIDQSPEFVERSAVWLSPGNHNFLRLTRILTSLRVLGLPDHATALLGQLELIYQANRQTIGEETVAFWRRAVHVR
jgi:Opioid growth factor receptor (OGFr) conserved region